MRTVFTFLQKSKTGDIPHGKSPATISREICLQKGSSYEKNYMTYGIFSFSLILHIIL